jgi:hypothetical protein
LQGIHLLNILFLAVLSILHEPWWSCFFMHYYNKIDWWFFIVAIWCYWLFVVMAVLHPMTLWTLLVFFFAEIFRCSSMYCIVLNEKPLLKLYKIYSVSYYHLIELHCLITYKLLTSMTVTLHLILYCIATSFWWMSSHGLEK